MASSRPSSGASASSAPVEDGNDIVYPVHMLDDFGKSDRSLMKAWVMKFNDELDHKMLRHSLSKLLMIGDWRKLAGRVNRRDDGKLEIRVSKNISFKDEAFVFNFERLRGFDWESLTDSFLEPKNGPFIVHNKPAGFRRFMETSATAVTLKEIIDMESPLLTIRFTACWDSTLVSVLYPRIVMDDICFRNFLAAWSNVLAGREDKVPRVFGVDRDIPWEAADPKKKKEKGQEKLLNRGRCTSNVGKLMLFGRMVLDFFVYDAMAGTIFIPNVTVDMSRRKALAELASCGGSGDKGQLPDIRDTDVLAAWVIQMITLTRSKPRKATIESTYSLTGPLQRILDPEGVYIGNLELPTYTFLSADVATGSLGQIALAHRQSTLRQTTEAQSLALLRHVRKECEAAVKTKDLYFGDSAATQIEMSDSCRLEMHSAAQFGPAVKQKRPSRGEGSSNPPGTMVQYYSFAMDGELDEVLRNCFDVANDHKGDYRIHASLRDETWHRIKEELRKWRGETTTTSDTELNTGR